MCKKVVITYRCAHQEEQFKPCDACAAHCGNADYCKNIAVEQATSDDVCIFDGCRWEEFEGIWRCCSCRKGPNREGICKWKVKGNPCGHNFCEECTGMAKRSSITPGSTPAGKKATAESKKNTPPESKNATAESKKSTPPEGKKTTAESKQRTAGKRTAGRSSASNSSASNSSASKGKAASTPSRRA